MADDRRQPYRERYVHVVHTCVRVCVCVFAVQTRVLRALQRLNVFVSVFRYACLSFVLCCVFFCKNFVVRLSSCVVGVWSFSPHTEKGTETNTTTTAMLCTMAMAAEALEKAMSMQVHMRESFLRIS